MSQNNVRALVVEDEPLAQELMISMLAGLPNIQVVGRARNGRAGLELIRELSPDLVFLDIEMPVLNGFDLVKNLQSDHMPLIVFTTAFEQYAVEAFDLHAVDYLLKPFSEERLHRAMVRVFTRLGAADADYKQTLIGAMEAIAERKQVQDWGEAKLAIRESDGVLLVPQQEIDWVDAAGDYMCVHSAGETHIMRCTMKHLLSKLDLEHFRRIHRSTVVNVAQIQQIVPLTKGECFLILNCGEKLKVSRNYRDAIASLIK